MHHPDAPNLFVEILLPLFVTLAIYLLPAVVAFTRSKPRRWQILIGNVLLGWTFFIWCYCLILALAPKASGADYDD